MTSLYVWLLIVNPGTPTQIVVPGLPFHSEAVRLAGVLAPGAPYTTTIYRMTVGPSAPSNVLLAE